MKKTLQMVKAFRAADATTPMVLMGYYNPIYVYPVDRFIADAVQAGADGLIVVDMPPEEDAELRPAATAAGLNFIRLATPTTDAARLPAVLANTSGFLYYVSIAGITGTAAPDIAAVGAHVGRIKAHTDLPVAVGFGVKTEDQVSALAVSPKAWWWALPWSAPLPRASMRRARPRARPSRRCLALSSGSPRRCGKRPRRSRFRLELILSGLNFESFVARELDQ